MIYPGKKRTAVQILAVLTVFTAFAVGAGIGLALAYTLNTDIRGDLSTYEPALPTQIMDRNGELITEIFSDEKRDIVPIDELPKHLIYALISREDDTFFQHKGFSFKGTIRAAWNIFRGRYFSGGSTLTQQVAGRYYADRTQVKITRKLRELWYAFQLERSLTKNEILELYMNEMYFGHNAYGVEAASQFYFGHSARDISVAEAAILVIQLASPARYSPINHPTRARDRQLDVLNQMVSLGYITRDEADISFQNYWDGYDYQRSNIASAYIDNDSKAPYFSEYVRIRLNDMLYGAADIHKDGYIVHTTLDLRQQKIADTIMNKAFHSINEQYRTRTAQRLSVVDSTYLPIIELLSLTFDLEDIRVIGAREKNEARQQFYSTMTPTLEMLSLMFNIDDLKRMTRAAYQKSSRQQQRNIVEGSLVTIDNHTGHIHAMVGGSDFETKQYNRATSARVQPGSAFKPLYYSAAISSRLYNTATRFYDGPIVFYDDAGTQYTPLNFLGNWHGSVLLRYALATSMNIPSLQLLDGVGFEAAIERASRLLGMEDRRDDRRLFPRSFPLGLGVTSVAPIDMARAFATFPNQGKAVEPIAILKVLDRSGNTVLDLERDRLREQQRDRGRSMEIMSPQEAYLMVDMLKSAVDYGTLMWRRINVGGFNGMPMAGKTGTTQNWGDAWTLGFSPYFTTAIWFGFDQPGNSLGRELTGATAAGPVWAEFMKEIHTSLPVRQFERPQTGLVELKVCSLSGMLPTNDCTDGIITELFIAGTEPKQFCTLHSFKRERREHLVDRLQNTLMIEDFSISTYSLSGLSDFLLDDLYFDDDIYIEDELFPDSDWIFSEDEDQFSSDTPFNPFLD